jgi:tRNA(Ile)-lysidine synthase
MEDEDERMGRGNDLRTRASAGARSPRRSARRASIIPSSLFPVPDTALADAQPARAGFDPARWSQLARAVGLAPDAAVIVALSGGADSVYLLRVVAAASPRPRVYALHVDHGLRGDAGRADARFCEDLCRELAVPFALRELHLHGSTPSLEAVCRVQRYRELCAEAARRRVHTILTGHHADDALETLLQRWLRGTSIHGLAGLRARARLAASSGGAAGDERLNTTPEDIEIVRPLIALRREEVRQTLRAMRVEWREDESNASARFLRNRVRNVLLPQIAGTCGEGALENLRAFSAAVETLEERCAELTADVGWEPPLYAAACRGRGEDHRGGTLARARLLELVDPLRRRALWRLVTEGSGHAPGRAHLDAVLADLEAGRCRRHGLRGGWSLLLRSKLVHLEPPGVPAATGPADGGAQLDLPFADARASTALRASTATVSGAREVVLAVPGCVALPDGRVLSAERVDISPAADVPRAPSCVELDAEGIDGMLRVRTPKSGDRFHALGAPGSKRLARFLADVGLPRGDRSRVPLVLAGDEIIWVAGIRPCERRRVGGTTRARLRLELHPGAPAEGDFPARARYADSLARGLPDRTCSPRSNPT